jgi:prepilin signal peptidase PulO-like enzyme (type II secretory pathway)
MSDLKLFIFSFKGHLRSIDFDVISYEFLFSIPVRLIIFSFNICGFVYLESAIQVIQV